MTRTSSDMAERLLAAPPAPLAEGVPVPRVVEHRGRRSGTAHRTALAVLLVDGRWYLVAPVRARDWVRNLTANQDCAVLTATGSTACRALPADGDEATEVVAAYLAGAEVPWALRAFPVPADASAEQITAHLDTMAVFRLIHR